MALSINQILAAVKVEGVTLEKVSTEAGSYFLVGYRGWGKSIYVNAIAHMDRRQWVETILSFVTEVIQDAPGENTFRPEPEEPAEPVQADRKPLAVKLVYNVDGSISIFSARKLVERMEDGALSAQERVDAFLQGWFGDHPQHVRRKFRVAAKRES